MAGKANGGRVSSSVAAALFALLPKCPACFLFLFAPLGLSLPRSGLVLTFAATLLLAAPALYFFAPACRACGPRPVFLALAGSLVMALGRFAFGFQSLVTVGAVMVIGAFVWMPRTAHSRQACGPCPASD